MNIKIYFAVVFIFFINALPAATRPVNKQTIVFSVKGADYLLLDKYDDQSISGEKPCIIFLFGGGFVNGKRDNADYNAFFNQLVNYGYVVISIDYRLGLKDIQNEEDLNPEKVIKALKEAIFFAVEDLYDATKYTFDHAEEWNINKDLIVACGSSAGAVTVLQGEYGICNRIGLTEKLPKDFNYAGIISFAGAIMAGGDLTWNEKPAPVLMFHGDADSNVPYNKLTHGPIGLFGTKYIGHQFEALKFPYYFYDVRDLAHEISNIPMHQNLGEIKTFMDKFVIGKQLLMIHSQVSYTDKINVKKDFGIMDYLITNFGK